MAFGEGSSSGLRRILRWGKCVVKVQKERGKHLSIAHYFINFINGVSLHRLPLDGMFGVGIFLHPIPPQSLLTSWAFGPFAPSEWCPLLKHNSSGFSENWNISLTELTHTESRRRKLTQGNYFKVALHPPTLATPARGSHSALPSTRHCGEWTMSTKIY